MACCGLSNMSKPMGEKILTILCSYFVYLDLVTHDLDTVLFYPKIVPAACRSACGKGSFDFFCNWIIIPAALCVYGGLGGWVRVCFLTSFLLTIVLIRMVSTLI